MSKNHKDLQMLSTADPTQDAHPFLADLIEDSERRLGSKTLAYEAVAKMVGLSMSWIEKAFNRRGGLTLKVPVYRDIAVAYIGLCERIEAREQRERERRAALLERAHAALASTAGVVPRVSRQTEGGDGPGGALTSGEAAP